MHTILNAQRSPKVPIFAILEKQKILKRKIPERGLNKYPIQKIPHPGTRHQRQIQNQPLMSLQYAQRNDLLEENESDNSSS